MSHLKINATDFTSRLNTVDDEKEITMRVDSEPTTVGLKKFIGLL